MKGCRIEIALKARPRVSLLVAAAVTLSGAFFSAQAQEPIKIGFGVSLTGGLASSGKAHLMSKQIWAEEINAKGGLLGRPIKLVYYDDQTNAATVPGIYAKLIDVDKVDLLMGHATNLIVAAMPLIIERKKLVMVLLALGSNAEFKYPRYFQSAAFGPDSKGVLSNNFFAVAKSLAPEPKTVALVGADAEFSKSAVEGARDEAKKRGLKVVYDRTYPPSTVDFGPVIRGIATANPDLVYVGSYPVDTSGLIRAARELNFSPKLFGGGMVGTQAASLQGDLGDMLNDVVSYELYCPAVADKFPEVEPLLKKYQPLAKEKGIDPHGYYVPPFAYCTMQILDQAVTGTGGLDQDKMAKFLHANTFKTIVGDVKFGPDGEWDHGRLLTVQFRGLKGQGMDQFTSPSAEVVLHPAEYRTGELHYPMGLAKQ